MRDASTSDGMVIDDTRDTDGDGIADVEEGRRSGTDTDGDGTPDFRDEDSDGDGIPDSVEAGDDNPATPARDSDGDGNPDFRDLDSDNNGLGDRDESTADTDGDGRPDFADTDDDNDRVPDAVEVMNGGPSVDTDGDGIFDFKDPDSDNDTILDGDERDLDTDGDGLEDWADLDTDSDGVSDAEEAGDADLFTSPVDTDSDGIQDFRDPDSDNDGVSDLDEAEAGTSRTEADSDMDGVSDLIEIGAGTNPLDMADSPRTRGDFVFVVPWMEAPDPERDTLEFSTALQFVDVYFGFDTTGSMRAELAAMSNATTGVPAIIAELVCDPGEDPATSGCIPDIWTGVGTFDEIDTFRNRVSLQPDPAVTAAAIPGTGGGQDEAPIQAPACVADERNCTNGTRACVGGGVGCPGFREEAVRIYVQITDADNQCSGGRCGMFTAAFTGAELMRQNINFISLVGTDDDDGSGTPDSIARSIGVASGSVNAMGQPFVFPAIDGAVVMRAVEAIRALGQSPFRITIEATEEPDDDGDALRFIDFLETNTSGVGACTADLATEDTDGDGRPDAFPAVRPGTSVCWDVVPIMNDIQEPALSPLVYRARLTVLAEGSPVDDRLVFFLVPPRIEIPMGPD